MTQKPAFRPDLEGLRAVAVALVLLYHARVPLVTGGYVGVDVFFVLSGFLITGLLIRELAATGRVDFAAFYARRARRLLPASALALIVTVALAAILLPPMRMPDLVGDTVSAGLYVSNLRFAAQATDYLASALPPSPVLHFWSLGVEEQFYLFWPALLVLAAGVAFRGGRREDGVRRVAIALAVVLIASLAFEVWLTGVAQPWAFFSLPSRAWELALGGLLSLPVSSRIVPRRLASGLGWIGVAIIVAAGLVFDDRTPFPGTAVLLPAVGAALVIAAGLGRRDGLATAPAPMAIHRLPAAGAILSLGPMRWLGRISYSLYLWHWPLLVLPAAALGAELDLPWRLLLAAIAVGVAALSQRFVEDPIRHGRFVGLAARRSLAMAAALAVAVALASVSASALSVSRLTTFGAAAGGSISEVPLPADPPSDSTRPLSAIGQAAALPVASGLAPGPGDAAVSLAAPDAVPPSPTPTPTLPPPPGGPVPADLAPALMAAASDLPAIYADGCHLEVPETVSPTCAFGDSGSAVRVVLFGDSHAAQWFPALQRLATQHGWRLESMTKSSCTPASVTVWNSIVDRSYTECDQWRRGALARIAEERPSLVVVSTSRLYQLVVGGQELSVADRPDLWSRALATTMRALAGSAANVVLLGDTPRSVADPPGCLSQHLGDTAACTVPFNEAVDAGQIALEAAVAARTSIAFADPTPWVCRFDPCPAVYGRFLIYRDQGHLTRTYAAALAARLFAVLPPIGP